MSNALRTLLQDEHVHVLDGAMGTMLYNRGVFVNVCYDELNLKQPRLIQDIHEEYVRAGAEIIETNTFGANPVKLGGYGLVERTGEINRRAAEIARQAAGARVAVVGAIGPLGIRIEPYGPTSRDEAKSFFERQAEGLLAGGVDGFVLETFSDLDEIHEALNAVRALGDLAVIAQMTIGDDGHTAYGTDVEAVARRLTDWGADAVGLNCSVGPAGILEGIERMAAVTDCPLAAQPNAGLPRAVGDRKIYLSGPEYMATYAQRLVAAGARFVGGCCGTTPDHIKAIRELVAPIKPQRVSGASASALTSPPPPGIDPAPLSDRSAWGRRIGSGDFAVSVELVPPKGCDPRTLIEHSRALETGGIHAVSILDGQRAHAQMGVIPSAIIVEREVGIETIVHYTCRDRNMVGMTSDLLGAAAAGLRNVLIITGDPPATGPYPDSTAVFDIDSIGLANLVHRLNLGLDPGGNPIGQPTKFVIGVAVNPAAIDIDRELRRLAWKVEAGAEFAVTQPVFDPGRLEHFLRRVEEYRLPIVAGIWPLISLRNAEFLANEVPGVHVPDSVIGRMRSAQEHGGDAALAEGVRIAQEMLGAVRENVQGAQVSAPLGRVDVALEVAAAGKPRG